MKRFLTFLLSVLMMFSLLMPLTAATAATTSTKITVSTSNVASSGKIKITWNAVKDAKKYEVYRAGSKSGTYSKIFTTTNLSCTTTSVTAGYTYYFKVKALNSSGKVLTTSSIVDRTCDCAAPSVTISIDEATGKPVLKWEKVTGASKYEIYRSDKKDGTYQKQLTTVYTSYTNNSANPGDNFFYKVRALSSRTSYADSAFSAIKEKTCDCARPVVTTSNDESTGKNIIRWKSIDGAAKYEVYRAGSKTGTYTKVYTTIGTAYTDKASNAGYTYYYKVKAISAKTAYADSAYSTIANRTCDCAMVTNATVDYNDSGNVIFTWDKVANATSYKVYRANAKYVGDKPQRSGDYSLIKTVTEAKFTDTTAKVGNYYFYKIVACSSRSSYADSAALEGPAYPLFPKAKNLKGYSVAGINSLKWDPISGVQGYIILVGDSDDLETMEPIEGVGSLLPTYTGKDIVKGKYYCVIGVKDMGADADPIPSVPAIYYFK